MVNNSYIAIAPRNETEAYVCWDLNPHHLQQMLDQTHSLLTLYICDITDLNSYKTLSQPTPCSAQPSFVAIPASNGSGASECSGASESSGAHRVQSYTLQPHVHECYVIIPALHRDYVAELGYFDANGTWFMLTQSIPLRMYPLHSSNE